MFFDWEDAFAKIAIGFLIICLVVIIVLVVVSIVQGFGAGTAVSMLQAA